MQRRGQGGPGRQRRRARRSGVPETTVGGSNPLLTSRNTPGPSKLAATGSILKHQRQSWMRAEEEMESFKETKTPLEARSLGKGRELVLGDRGTESYYFCATSSSRLCAYLVVSVLEGHNL